MTFSIPVNLQSRTQGLKPCEVGPVINPGLKAGSHMPAACLRLYHYASTCRRNTGKVELNSTFPAYRRCNCGTGGNRRTNIRIIYILNYHRHRRRYVAGTSQAYM